MELQKQNLTEQKNLDPETQDIARFAEIDSDDDSVRSELEEVDFDQFDFLEELGEGQEEFFEEKEEEEEEARKEIPIDHSPVSDLVPEGATVAQVGFALVEIQRRFKLPTVAMDSFAELLQVTTGEGSRAPSFFAARGMSDKSGVDYRVVDVCINDCCVFDNAPFHCDPAGTRQHGGRSKCPECHESRYVLLGPQKGTPRKQVIVFSLRETIKMLFAQPGFSQRLNARHGHPHPLTENENCIMEVRTLCCCPDKIVMCRISGIRLVGNSKWTSARR
jgi:hypothetical protein